MLRIKFWPTDNGIKNSLFFSYELLEISKGNWSSVVGKYPYETVKTHIVIWYKEEEAHHTFVNISALV